MSTADTLPRGRVSSVDAYRGFVMFLMLAQVLRLSRMAASFPDSSFWQFLGEQQTHVEWSGCTLHDLIQPSFTFLVGVAVPLSLATRQHRGQTTLQQGAHALWRSLVLILLGILLRSASKTSTNFTFEDTLTQIGLGYFPLFLLGLIPYSRWRPAAHWLVLAAVLLGYWIAFVLYPAPGTGFDFTSLGVPPDWPNHYAGLAAHWNKNSNLAWAFDQWFLNLFPREQPFTHNAGGYATLSFIPTLGTMILGLIAGDWLHLPGSSWSRVGKFILVGGACLGAGLLLDYLGICPSVKRIWTPAWTLVSGGWCFLILAGFYVIMDVGGWQAWAFPLRVIGMNSIAAYCMAHLIGSFLQRTYQIHLGQEVFKSFGEAYEPFVSGCAVLLTYWLILFWMYRRKIFIRI